MLNFLFSILMKVKQKNVMYKISRHKKIQKQKLHYKIQMTYLCQESQFQARIKGYITMCPSQEEYLKIDPASIKNTDGFLGNCKIQLIINKLLISSSRVFFISVPVFLIPSISLWSFLRVSSSLFMLFICSCMLSTLCFKTLRY